MSASCPTRAGAFWSSARSGRRPVASGPTTARSTRRAARRAAPQRRPPGTDPARARPVDPRARRPVGTASDGRLFRTYRGSIYLPSTLWQVLQKARPKAFTAAQVASPLARKPYDFRHAGVSWRLNAGTPATLVAEWAGHTVKVLYRIYAHCLDGDDERWFSHMEQALG